MKPIVTSIGLLLEYPTPQMVEAFRSTAVEMTSVAEDGKLRPMTCLTIRKLPAWLYSISPNKVKPELFV